MHGIILSPTPQSAISLLASLSRSMTLQGDPQSEFIGTNKAMGDLTPTMTRWLETGQFNPLKNRPYNRDTLYKFRLYTPKSTLVERIQFWNDDVPIESPCLKVTFTQNFSPEAVEHLKQSEYFILCDQFSSNPKNDHFEKLAHLFLQMYSLDCALKRVAFVVHCPKVQQPTDKSTVEIAKHVFGAKCYEVFKTFCKPTTRFDFFMVDVFNLSPGSHHPCTLDQWLPHNAIDPFLFAVRGLTSAKTMTLKDLEREWKD